MGFGTCFIFHLILVMRGIIDSLLLKNKGLDMHSKTLLISLFTSLLMLLSIYGMAQNGASDLRFLVHSLDCEAAEVCFDIQVRAGESGREFYLSEQNYRFSFSRTSITQPHIEEELDVSGLIMGGDGALGFSLYAEHSTLGSLDTVFSYNVELSGGDGIFLDAEEYVSVGRLCAEVLDFNEPFSLQWHTTGVFPASFVGEIYDANLRTTTEIISVLSYHQDISDVCENIAPLAADDVADIEPNGHVTICLPTNDTDADNELDISSVKLLNTPPASEGTVTLDAATGCITFVAAQGFTGLSTFDYEICDEGKHIPAYGGNLNSELVAEPDPQDPDILVAAPACDVATVTIGVGVSVGLLSAENDAAFFDLAAFPNPANDVVNISYTLPEKSEVGMALWNVLGQPVQELELETLQTGTHNKSLNVSELSAGNYLVVLNIAGKVATKMIQIK